jgi:hypothetical protein
MIKLGRIRLKVRHVKIADEENQKQNTKNQIFKNNEKYEINEKILYPNQNNPIDEKK